MNKSTQVWDRVFSELDASPQAALNRIAKHLRQRGKLISFVYRHFKNSLENRTIVEIATGTSVECLLFSLSGADAIGIDKSPKAIEFAQKIQSLFTRRSMLLTGDGFSLPLPSNSADLVFSQGFVEHFQKKEVRKLISEQNRILKPGGVLIIDAPNYFSPYELYKWVYQIIRPWPFGEERGIGFGELYRVCKEQNMSYLEKYGWSFRGYPYKSVMDFSYMVPLLLVRNFLKMFNWGHDSIGVIFKKT